MVFSKPYRFHDGIEGSSITVWVTPKSSRNEISGILEDGTVKIRLRNAPVEDKANQELIQYLSKIFEVPQGSVKIIFGCSQRKKVIVIAGLTAKQVREKILEKLDIKK